MDRAALAWTRRMVASRRSRVWVRDVLRLRREARRRWALWGVKSSVDGVGGISAEREAEYSDTPITYDESDVVTPFYIT